MNIAQRYRKLTVWNKFQVWAGLASIIGVPLAFLLWLWPATHPNQDAPRVAYIGPSVPQTAPIVPVTPTQSQTSGRTPKKRQKPAVPAAGVASEPTMTNSAGGVQQTMINSPGSIQANGPVTITKDPPGREISSAAEARMIERLAPFAGKMALIYSAQGDREAARLARRFEDIFKAAGWKTFRSTTMTFTSGGEATGAEVMFKADGSRPFELATLAALQTSGIEGHKVTMPSLEDDQIHIEVYAKPE